jgi:hypothetical protein
MRRLIDLSCKAKESFHFVRLTKEARLDLSWWIECFEFFHGSCAFKCDFPLPSHCFQLMHVLLVVEVSVESTGSM